jgi:hypothetical protein
VNAGQTAIEWLLANKPVDLAQPVPPPALRLRHQRIRPSKLTTPTPRHAAPPVLIRPVPRESHRDYSRKGLQDEALVLSLSKHGGRTRVSAGS